MSMSCRVIYFFMDVPFHVGLFHPLLYAGLSRRFQDVPLYTDIGEYRIIYRIEEDLLKIALVGKRNDSAVYRELARL